MDPHRPHARAVAVADSVHVELPAPVVAARLRAGGSWLLPHLQQAVAEGEDHCAGGSGGIGGPIRVRIGPGERQWLGKTVAVRLGPVRSECEQALVIPLTWQATGPSRLFPRLEAELRVVALDQERAELSLSGRYCRRSGGPVRCSMTRCWPASPVRRCARSCVGLPAVWRRGTQRPVVLRKTVTAKVESARKGRRSQVAKRCSFSSPAAAACRSRSVGG